MAGFLTEGTSMSTMSQFFGGGGGGIPHQKVYGVSGTFVTPQAGKYLITAIGRELDLYTFNTGIL